MEGDEEEDAFVGLCAFDELRLSEEESESSGALHEREKVMSEGEVCEDEDEGGDVAQFERSHDDEAKEADVQREGACEEAPRTEHGLEKSDAPQDCTTAASTPFLAAADEPSFITSVQEVEKVQETVSEAQGRSLHDLRLEEAKLQGLASTTYAFFVKGETV